MKKLSNTEYKSNVRRKNALVLTTSILLLFITFLISINLGSFEISFDRIIATRMGNGDKNETLTVFTFRLPRILVSGLIGVGLDVSGCLMQSITQNPLADPSILGVTSGAGMFVMLYIMVDAALNFENPIILPVFSLFGAFLSATIVYLLSQKNGLKPTQLVLTGVAIAAGFSAVTTILVVKLDETQYEFFATWQAGRLWNADWDAVVALFIWLLLFIPYIYSKSKTLDVLVLGDGIAQSLGVSLVKEKRNILAAAVALVSFCVAIGGNISFVGLISPHIARKLVGPRHMILLPASAIIGAVLVAVADTLGRTIIEPSSIPTGIMTAIIGTPYFVYLIVKKGR